MLRLIKLLLLLLMYLVALLPAGFFLYLITPNLLDSGANGLVGLFLAGVLSVVLSLWLIYMTNYLRKEIL